MFTKHDVLPLTLYEFELPDALYIKTLKQCESLDWDAIEHRDDKNHFGRTFDCLWHQQEEFQDLVKFIEDCLEEVRVEIQASALGKLAVSSLWPNRSVKGEWHHGHTHNWSFLTGVIYIKGITGNTWFSRESEWEKITNFNMRREEEQQPLLIHKQSPKPGSMFVLPSNLFHSVDEVTEGERITMSFNSFPSVSAGDITAYAGVNLKVL